MKYIEKELYEYICDYCDTKNIPIDLHFRCFGDVNKFYTHDIEFGCNCVNYYAEDLKDIKNFFRHYLDIMWSNRSHAVNRVALYIEDIVDMDGWYDVIVGGGLFEDDTLA